ncbi:MAG: hypothetical protein GX239_04085, partial [Clostridiaceae bacterium]|nr:hypothetical protein [Clostridiaceae bacterium]
MRQIKQLITLVLCMTLLTSCSLIKKSSQSSPVDMDRFNNPQGIISGLETRDENKPEVNREIFITAQEILSWRKDLNVLDTYTFKEDYEGTLYYPMVMSYQTLLENDQLCWPKVSVAGQPLDIDLQAGSDIGMLASMDCGAQDESTIINKLNDDNYFEEAGMSAANGDAEVNFVQFTDIPRIESFAAEQPEMTISFPDDIRFLSYGFNAISGYDTTIEISRSITATDAPGSDEVYLVFFDEVPEFEINFRDNAKDTLIAGKSPTMKRKVIPFREVMAILVEDFFVMNYGYSFQGKTEGIIERVLADYSDWFEADKTFAVGEDIISNTYHISRIFYLPIDTTIQTGETITIERIVPSSHNFGGLSDTSFEGYHILGHTDHSVKFLK